MSSTRKIFFVRLLAFVIAPSVAVANMLWGSYRSSAGIQPSDLPAAIFLWLFVSAAGLLGIRLATRAQQSASTAVKKEPSENKKN